MLSENYSKECEKTRERIQLLKTYFDKELPTQKNKLLPKGYELRTVQPHIGPNYDCLINKKKDNSPFRILVSGLEALNEDGYSIKKRTKQILDESEFFPKSNNHMKGTTILLKYIIGELLGYTLERRNKEYIGDTHIFNFFALTNWHITGAFQSKNKARRNKNMNIIAVENFIKQIEVLEPSIVILQGININVDYYFSKYYPESENKWVDINTYPSNLPDPDRYRIYIPLQKNKFRNPLVKFVHPSDRGKNANPWSRPDAEYFTDVIKPVLADIIKRYNSYVNL
jgi:hypothetical protein